MSHPVYTEAFKGTCFGTYRNCFRELLSLFKSGVKVKLGLFTSFREVFVYIRTFGHYFTHLDLIYYEELKVLCEEFCSEFLLLEDEFKKDQRQFSHGSCFWVRVHDLFSHLVNVFVKIDKFLSNQLGVDYYSSFVFTGFTSCLFDTTDMKGSISLVYQYVRYFFRLIVNSGVLMSDIRLYMLMTVIMTSENRNWFLAMLAKLEYREENLKEFVLRYQAPKGVDFINFVGECLQLIRKHGTEFSSELYEKLNKGGMKQMTWWGYGKFLRNVVNPYELREEGEYVGLENLGATCYLNSIIQALFETVPFKYHVVSYRGDNKIILELQRLFVEMEIGNAKVVSTKPLTDSFGWNDRDTFVQHDAHELLKILFDSVSGEIPEIEKYFKGTAVSYVQCKNCNGLSERIDEFFDLQLVVRGAHDLSQSFQKYQHEELLEEDNKYFCEKCNGKFDALKGIKICGDEKLPDILTVNLKRFDINPMSPTLSKMKLNDVFMFKGEYDISELCGDRSNKNVDSKYELYAILVHKGTINFGHYFAFILKEQGWYEYNDDFVCKIKQEYMHQRVYGGYYMGRKDKPNNCNAYMLLFRRKVPTNPITVNDIESVIPERLRVDALLRREILETKYNNFEESRNYYLQQINQQSVKMFLELNTQVNNNPMVYQNSNIQTNGGHFPFQKVGKDIETTNMLVRVVNQAPKNNDSHLIQYSQARSVRENEFVDESEDSDSSQSDDDQVMEDETSYDMTRRY